jgi:type IV secretory pathway VirB10-like protein
MRTDYILYIVAVICFIIAGWVGATYPFTGNTANMVTVIVLVIIGIIFIWGGYSLRPSIPKVTRTETTMPPTKPAMEEEQPTMTPPPPAPEPEPEPTPAPTPEPTPTAEPEKVEETPQPETPPSETKPVRKRRERKKTA